MKTPVKPGIFRDVPRNDYHAWDAAHATGLKRFEKSAAHAREAMLHPPEPTAALDVGDALHAAVLEPVRFATEYAVAPKLDRRRKADREEWEQFEASHPGAVVLKENEGEMIAGMAASVRAHETAARLIGAPGVVELSAFWFDAETKMPCKLRADRFTSFAGWPCIVDLKSTKDASPRGFPREATTYGYHVQAAWYLDGLNAIERAERRFLFIAVEKEPPYAAAVYELDVVSLEAGRTQARRYLLAWSKARKDNLWPGYPAGLTTLTLPPWAFREENVE